MHWIKNMHARCSALWTSQAMVLMSQQIGIYAYDYVQFTCDQINELICQIWWLDNVFILTSNSYIYFGHLKHSNNEWMAWIRLDWIRNPKSKISKPLKGNMLKGFPIKTNAWEMFRQTLRTKTVCRHMHVKYQLNISFHANINSLFE